MRTGARSIPSRSSALSGVSWRRRWPSPRCRSSASAALYGQLSAWRHRPRRQAEHPGLQCAAVRGGAALAEVPAKPPRSRHARRKAHRRRLRTINGLARLNIQITHRTRVATLFPSGASLLRLASAVLLEIGDDSETERAFLNMEA
jgi:hypothetical protein